MTGIWRESFHVRSYESGPDGRVRTLTVFDYLQEAAANHAQALGVSNDLLADRGAAWVLARLYVVLEAFPRWHSVLTVETWPSGVDRLYASRDFALRDAEGRLCAHALSSWLLVDTRRKRPMRMPSYVTEIAVPDRPRPLNGDFPPSIEEQPLTPGLVRDVPGSAMDLNGHANNVRFIEWGLDALPPARFAAKRPRALDISFRAEAVAGDRIRSDFAVMGESGLNTVHQIRNDTDGRLLASMSVLW